MKDGKPPEIENDTEGVMELMEKFIKTTLYAVVTQIRLPQILGDGHPERDNVGTFSIMHGGYRVGTMYIVIGEDIPLGKTFKLEMKMTPMPHKEFVNIMNKERGYKAVPKSEGIKPV